MVGPEYWQALSHTDYWFSYGDSPQDAFQQLLASDEDIPDNLEARGFILINDPPLAVADKLRRTAKADQERPWLNQYAAAITKNPSDTVMIVRSLFNMPDGRILDPDGPLGCRQSSDTSWVFFGFMPIEEQREEPPPNFDEPDVEPMTDGECCDDQEPDLIVDRLTAANRGYFLDGSLCSACNKRVFLDYCFTCEVAFLSCHGRPRCSLSDPHISDGHETTLEPFSFQFCENCGEPYDVEDDGEKRCPRCRRLPRSGRGAFFD